MLGGRQPERHGGEVGRGRLLPLPVERGGVAHLGDAAADRVEHLEGGRELARGMHGDVHAAAGERRDPLGDALGRHAGPGQALRPGGDHAPAFGLRARDGGGGEGCGAECGGESVRRVSLVMGRLLPPGVEMMHRAVAVADGEFVGGGDRGGDVGFRVRHRVAERCAFRELGGDRGGERAAGAVRVVGVDLLRREARDGVARHQQVGRVGLLARGRP